MIRINPENILPNTVDYEEFGYLNNLRTNETIQTQLNNRLLADGTMALTGKWQAGYSITVNKNTGVIEMGDGVFNTTQVNCFQLAPNKTFGANFYSLFYVDSDDNIDTLEIALNDTTHTNADTGFILRPVSGSGGVNAFFNMYGRIGGVGVSASSVSYGFSMSVRQKAGDSDFGNVVFDTIRPSTSNGLLYFRLSTNNRIIMHPVGSGECVYFSSPNAATYRNFKCMVGATEVFGVHTGGAIWFAGKLSSAGWVFCGSTHSFRTKAVAYPGSVSGVTSSLTVYAGGKAITFNHGIVIGIV